MGLSAQEFRYSYIMTWYKGRSGQAPRTRHPEMKALHSPVTHIAIRLVFVATILLHLCAPGVSQEKNQAQTRPAQQEPPAVLKVTTRLITVDVVARDRRGNPIRDL